MCEYSKAKGLSKKKEILVFFSKSLFFMKSELWLLNFSPREQFPFLLNKALIRVHSVLARQWLNVYRRLRSYVRRTISLLVYLSYLYVYLLDCVWWIDFFFQFRFSFSMNLIQSFDLIYIYRLNFVWADILREDEWSIWGIWEAVLWTFCQFVSEMQFCCSFGWRR